MSSRCRLAVTPAPLGSPLGAEIELQRVIVARFFRYSISGVQTRVICDECITIKPFMSQPLLSEECWPVEALLESRRPWHLRNATQQTFREHQVQQRESIPQPRPPSSSCCRMSLSGLRIQSPACLNQSRLQYCAPFRSCRPLVCRASLSSSTVTAERRGVDVVERYAQMML